MGAMKDKMKKLSQPRWAPPEAIRAEISENKSSQCFSGNVSLCGEKTKQVVTASGPQTAPPPTTSEEAEDRAEQGVAGKQMVVC